MGEWLKDAEHCRARSLKTQTKRFGMGGGRKGRKRDMTYRLFFKEAWLTRGTSGKKIFVFIKTKLRFCDGFKCSRV